MGGKRNLLIVGNTFGRLTVTGLDESRPGHVLTDCACGTKSKSIRGTALRQTTRPTRSCGCLNREQASAMGAATNKGKKGEAHPSYGIKKERHHNWKGDAISYSGTHWRLKAWFGPARKHKCFWCGNEARDWAFNNTCPERRRQIGGEGDGMYFCTHVECYTPVCRRDHRKLIDDQGLGIIDLAGRKVLAPLAGAR